MNPKDDRLTKEELQYLIERLSLPDDDEPADDAGTSVESSAAQGALQADLKKRLQRGVDEMRARNEEVPGGVLDLLERL